MTNRPPARVVVRPATRADADAWLAMRCVFWPEGSREEHRAELKAFFSGRARAHRAVGFTEAALVRCFRMDL